MKIMDELNPETNIETPVDNVEENVNEVNSDAAEQKEIDWKAEARKHEARAKENFELAKKWKEYEESQKTEDEKRAEELAKTRLELEELRTESLKKDIAAEKGVPTKALKYLSGSTREELEAQADEILSIITESATTKQNTKVNPEQGKPNGNTESDPLASWITDNILKN